ncbi:hypothetical protein SKAU_G00127340 [Synaphobranchus kaupii]|uniref:Uncharacterized protein n=1 Tax=Synaphobranchus kaupii TaxID=118154 RepID=A0A9Q1J302_SYNKA|nr:hypothetical protein SKAU_G00127340 [Synaphobranchus kaupii]
MTASSDWSRNQYVKTGRKEDGFDPSPVVAHYPRAKSNISRDNVNYSRTSCKHRTAGYSLESLASHRRLPLPYITKGEVERLVSSASRLIETAPAEVISLAGRLAELPRVKNRQANDCGRVSVFYNHLWSIKLQSDA